MRVALCGKTALLRCQVSIALRGGRPPRQVDHNPDHISRRQPPTPEDFPQTAMPGQPRHPARWPDMACKRSVGPSVRSTVDLSPDHSWLRQYASLRRLERSDDCEDPSQPAYAAICTFFASKRSRGRACTDQGWTTIVDGGTVTSGRWRLGPHVVEIYVPDTN